MSKKEELVLGILKSIGENPEREGLQETPARVAKAWDYLFGGYGKRPEDVLKVFEDGSENYDGMVIVHNIPIYSQCEHHMAPIIGHCHIGYIPNKKVVGLSKLPRLADIYMRRLQVQERLTTQIADALHNTLNPLGVGVVMRCRHMCMESRGVKIHSEASTTTSAMRGTMFHCENTRQEFLKLCSEAERNV